MNTSDIALSIFDHYTCQTKGSKEKHEQAKGFLPGGDTRTSTFFQPYPTFMTRGQGCHIYDCDGNRYIDFLNNYTSLIHGHTHPVVVEAIQKQLQHGTVFAAPVEEQIHLAELLCSRTPSIDAIRFCNSGTEANMMVIQLARAITGKDAIIKMEGGYHGSSDVLRIATPVDIDSEPLSPVVTNANGIPISAFSEVFLSRFNDLESTRRILEREKVAAIILEPMIHSGGMIPPQENYLQGMRDLAGEFDVLLIFDEVATFRLGIGGLQSIEGVEPDITTLGKIIGGGLPVGAFGGKKEYMDYFDPTGKAFIKHAGTYNGNSLVMAAGLATLQLYDQEAIDHVNRLGTLLKDGLENAFREAGVKGQVLGLGSLVQIHWTDEVINSPREAAMAKARACELPDLLHLEFLNRGIFIGKRGNCCISTPMTEKEIETFIHEFRQVLDLLVPYIRIHTPHLLA
ncbi:MAG: aspartate aminotransferase family protein [Anaerolineales bacterium]|nr:aspartate aminotransferase family protein [Anaerolineales bacterium]